MNSYKDLYKVSGVDVDNADYGISKITNYIKTTWNHKGKGEVLVDIGYFANVINIGSDLGIALCTDGVGSKTKIAEILKKYDTIGIDCVAMNVNDLICVGAEPISMLDYIGIDKPDPFILEQIGIGLTEGAKQARISISGGEISQLPNIINGFDLVGSAFGIVNIKDINIGQFVRPRDIIIGIASNGIHSNGLTLARNIFFHQNQFDINEKIPDLDNSIGIELLRPTEIYVVDILHLKNNFLGNINAMINITGDGLLNLNRITSNNVGFKINSLPPIPKIFKIIQEYGNVDDQTMFQTFNMGIGFCVIVPRNYVDDARFLLEYNGKKTFVIGEVIDDEFKSVYIEDYNLIGRGKHFEKIS
jgi:phosphoribosylformylglycinamidine cyclo-ligase